MTCKSILLSIVFKQNNKSNNPQNNNNMSISINSLFIPHVFQNIDEGKIREVFNTYGPIKDIRFVPKVGADAHKYNAVFIHFEEWNEAPETNNLLEELGNNGKTHVYYDEQWYWIVLFNTSKSNKDKDATTATTTTTTAMKKVKVLVKEKAPAKETTAMTTTATPITPTGTSSLPANANWAPKKVKKETTKETTKEEKSDAKRNLDTEFEKSNNNNNNHDEADTEDFTLVDASYVFNLEEENKNLRMEIQRLMTQQQGYMNLIRQQAGVMANMTSMPMSPMSMFGGSSFNPNAY